MSDPVGDPLDRADGLWAHLLAAHRGEVPDGGDLPPHEPELAVLACADARVPPSLLFDRPAGSTFVVRIAGNTAAPSAVASLDYAVAALGVPLVVVLGHTGCGAVQAAVDGVCTGHYSPVVAPLCELARSHPDLSVDELVACNVRATVAELAAHPGPLGQAARAGRIRIRGAVHDLRSGRLIDPDHLTPTDPLHQEAS